MNARTTARVIQITIVAMILSIVFYLITNTPPTASSSGSMKVLRTNGEITRIDNVLHYVSNDHVYSKLELAALTTLSRHYTIKLEN